MPICWRYLVTARRAIFHALFLEFTHQVIVAQRVGLVFVIDQFLQLDPDRIPSQVIPVLATGATDKERI